MVIGVPTFERVSLTKKREGAAWRVYVDGAATAIMISKGHAPRYREPQMYDVIRGNEDWLFETKSVAEAERVLAVVLGERPLTTPSTNDERKAESGK